MKALLPMAIFVAGLLAGYSAGGRWVHLHPAVVEGNPPWFFEAWVSKMLSVIGGLLCTAVAVVFGQLKLTTAKH